MTSPLHCVICCTAGSGSRTVCLNITAVPEEGTFKLNRFHINKSNVRRQWFLEEEEGKSSTGMLPPKVQCDCACKY